MRAERVIIVHDHIFIGGKMFPFPHRLVVLLLLLALALTACQSSGPGGPGGDDPRALEGVITGALTDRGGAPIAGAQVTLGGGAVAPAALELRPAAADLTTTDEHGRFAFDVPEAGVYTLTSLSDTEGAFMRVSVTRGPDGKLASDPISLQSAPLGGVAGSIAGHGAGAWAFLLGTSFLATTDAEGAFVISRVPAGTYQLAPGLLGAAGGAVTVTVEAGKVTTVTTPLELGPVITSVEPAGFVPEIYDDFGRPVFPTPTEFRIKGRGFGSTPGISQLRYAGQDVSDFVLSWADDEIVLDALPQWRGVTNQPVPEEALRFSFATATGETHSSVGGIVRLDIRSGDSMSCDDVYRPGEELMRIYKNVNRLWVRNSEILLSVTNGTAHAAPGQPAITQVTTDASGCAEAYIEPDASTRLPTVVEASYQGVAFPPEIVANFAYISTDTYELELGEQTFEGQLLSVDTDEPMADDGHYTADIGGYTCPQAGEAPVPLTLDAEGRFEVTITVESGCNQVRVFYRGAVLYDLHINVIYP